MEIKQKTFEKYCGNDILFVSILSISISFLMLSLFMDVFLISNTTITTKEAIIRLTFRIGLWCGISFIIMGYYMKGKLGRYTL